MAPPEPLRETAGRLEAELGDGIAQCVHCGLCLSACPTYVELGREMDSPRGRLYLLRALGEGRIEPTATVLEHLDLCLDCCGCETACPSGVEYGRIIEGARAILEPGRRRSWSGRAVRHLALRVLLPRRRLLAAAGWPLRLYRASGLRALARRSGALRLLPQRLRELEALAPEVRGPAFLADARVNRPARGPRRGRVALFAGCIMDHAMPEVHRATVRVLARNGYEVVVPRAQTCCGALHVHAGDRDTAQRLARRNVAAFAEAGVERVVVNSAGCGAQLREYAELLAGDPALADAARSLARATVDPSVLLAEQELERPTRRVPRRAVYDEPCHLLHAQGVSEQPRALLRAIPGLELVPLAESELCCGSAGVYNLTQPELARRLRRRKIEHIAAARADLVVTANPGCLLQLRAGVRERGLAVEVVHLVELLDRAYGD